jgi:hypothetical protein
VGLQLAEDLGAAPIWVFNNGMGKTLLLEVFEAVG